MDQNGPLTDTAAHELEDRAQRRDRKQIAADRVRANLVPWKSKLVGVA
jgi:hypothetical protein